tara:strand:- start:630 stop:953 length:324 start_codon:yes stop_codon:yes gene_type:complete
MKKVLKDYKDYKNYHRITDSDKKHLQELKDFIDNNINNIKDSTWFDMAGGFMMFCVQVDDSTYCIGNDLYDGENDSIRYENLRLRAFIELEKADYDLGLLLHEDLKI